MVQVVPPQDVISRDNVSVKVNAVLYFRIVDPSRHHQGRRLHVRHQPARANDRCASCSASLNSTRCSPNGDRLNADIQEILDSRPTSGVQGDRDRDQGCRPQRNHGPRLPTSRGRNDCDVAKVINAMGEQQAAEKLARLAGSSPRSRRRCSSVIRSAA